MSMFRYDHLKDPKTWIRVLILERGQYDDPLRAVLKHELLNKGPAYEAISYCWGSNKTPYEIEIGNGNSYSRLPITESLNLALRRFRDTAKDRRLWNDAVCINQRNESEKNHQVRLMGTIYAAAQVVLGYLGEVDESTPEALILLEKIHRAAQATSPDDTRRPLTWIRDNKLPLVTEAQRWKWDPLKAFFRRPWFHRKWIIQECTLASQLIFRCGDWERSWEWMALVDETIYGKSLGVLDYTTIENKEHASELQQGLAQFHSISTLRNALSNNVRYQLLDLVYRYQSSRATDLRDHMFALLGLASDTGDEALDPIYGKDNTVLQNCLRYADYFLQRNDSLELLYRAGLQGHKLYAPSWIPDWYGGHEGFSFEYAEGLWDPLRRPHFYDIARGTRRQLLSTVDREILGVKGLLIDTVKSLANQHLQIPDGQLQDKQFLLNQKQKHLVQCDALMSELSAYPAGEDLEDVKWRTLICNVTFNIERAPDTYRQAYEAWRGFLLMNSTAQERMSYAALQEPFRKVIDGFNGDKVFGVTGLGYAGMFPQSTKPDDVVAVLYGGEFPVVLRKLSSMDGANYELVGQCYIHGRMEDGQLDLRDPCFKEEDILLGGDYEIPPQDRRRYILFAMSSCILCLLIVVVLTYIPLHLPLRHHYP